MGSLMTALRSPGGVHTVTHAYSTRSAYCVYAQSLMTPLMWSEADRLHVKVTPRIFSELSVVTSNVRERMRVMFFLLLLS